MASRVDRAHHAAQEILETALEETGKQVVGLDGEEVARKLKRGDCALCTTFRNCLAHQIAGYLGRLDKGMRTIYSYSPDDACGVYETPNEALSTGCGIHLIAWTREKKASFERMLEEFTIQWHATRAKLLCARSGALCLALDVALVNDRQVRARQGYANMLGSLGVAPTPVWNEIKPIHRVRRRGTITATRARQSGVTPGR